MKSKQAGYALLHVLPLFFILFCIAVWVTNLVKFVDCDFQSDYKCEVLHGIGVILPPTSVVTVWFNSDGDPQ